MTKHKSPRLFFTGLSMGLADLIPGVSSGTIAFLYGIYDELLFTIKNITGSTFKLLLKGEFKQAFKSIPFSFIIPLFSGMLIAIFTMVNIVSFLLDNHPTLIWSLFFGLVLGSSFAVSKRVKKWSRQHIFTLSIGFVLTFILVGLPAADIASSPIVMFFSGIIGSIAMILPGISGSLILVLIGQYAEVIHAIHDKDFLTLAIFAAGIVTGLALFVRLLTWLLRKHHSIIIALLIGIMLGSLRAIWPWQVEGERGSWAMPLVSDFGTVFAIVLMALGFGLVVLLEKIGMTREHVEDINSREFRQETKHQIG
jgi:putative membrane protein